MLCANPRPHTARMTNDASMERFHRYYSLHRILSSRWLLVPRAAIERNMQTGRVEEGALKV